MDRRLPRDEDGLAPDRSLTMAIGIGRQSGPAGAARAAGRRHPRRPFGRLVLARSTRGLPRATRPILVRDVRRDAPPRPEGTSRGTRDGRSRGVGGDWLRFSRAVPWAQPIYHASLREPSRPGARSIEFLVESLGEG